MFWHSILIAVLKNRNQTRFAEARLVLLCAGPNVVCVYTPHSLLTPSILGRATRCLAQRCVAWRVSRRQLQQQQRKPRKRRQCNSAVAARSCEPVTQSSCGPSRCESLLIHLFARRVSSGVAAKRTRRAPGAASHVACAPATSVIDAASAASSNSRDATRSAPDARCGAKRTFPRGEPSRRACRCSPRGDRQPLSPARSSAWFDITSGRSA